MFVHAYRFPANNDFLEQWTIRLQEVYDVRIVRVEPGDQRKTNMGSIFFAATPEEFEKLPAYIKGTSYDITKECGSKHTVTCDGCGDDLCECVCEPCDVVVEGEEFVPVYDHDRSICSEACYREVNASY